MNRYQQFVSLSLEDFVKLIDDYSKTDDAPWLNWFDERYCSKCESVYVSKSESAEKLGFEPFGDGDVQCAYCEVNNYCRFFPSRESPSTKEIIEMWLKEAV